MGQWGTGYRESDDYLDYRSEYAQPLIDALERRLPEVRRGLYRDGSGRGKVADLAIYDLRGQLMFTYHTLSAESPNRDPYLTDDQIEVMTAVADFVQGQTERSNEDWRYQVEIEMVEVKRWLHQQQWDPPAPRQ